MNKDEYYKNLYKDIINDNYHGNSITINNNKELLKLLFLKCSKSVINDKNFSFGYIKRCIDFVASLKDDEKELIDDDFLSFFNILNANSFEIMNYLFHPNYDNCPYFIIKILSNSKLYGSNNLNTNYDVLNNLNAALMYYKENSSNNCIKNLVIMLFIHGFKINDYSYLYNYLNNPDYYHDKISNSDVVNEPDLNFLIRLDFYYVKKSYTFNYFMDNLQFIFSVHKKIIR